MLLFISGFVLFTSGFVRFKHQGFLWFTSGLPAVYIRVTCDLYRACLRGLLVGVGPRGDHSGSLVASYYRAPAVVGSSFLFSTVFFMCAVMTARFREAIQAAVGGVPLVVLPRGLPRR